MGKLDHGPGGTHGAIQGVPVRDYSNPKEGGSKGAVHQDQVELSLTTLYG